MCGFDSHPRVPMDSLALARDVKPPRCRWLAIPHRALAVTVRGPTAPAIGVLKRRRERLLTVYNVEDAAKYRACQNPRAGDGPAT